MRDWHDCLKEYSDVFKKDLNEKVGLFDKLQDQCLVCEKPFDKKSKEHAQTWFVTVREEQGVVNLYCPECWGTAQKVIEEFSNKEVNDDS